MVMAIEGVHFNPVGMELEWYRGFNLVSIYRDEVFLLVKFRVSPTPLDIDPFFPYRRSYYDES
jgi:hypothetical protein